MNQLAPLTASAKTERNVFEVTASKPVASKAVESMRSARHSVTKPFAHARQATKEILTSNALYTVSHR